ncbi:MAG: branched-chain amino acid ABC transporter permease [Anaerolineae bacterium]
MTQVLRENSKAIQWMIYLAGAVLLILWLQPMIASKTPIRLVQSTVNGVFIGGIYAIIALGIVVINKASGVFNFAHGGMMMISGYAFFAFFTSNSISIFAAVILAVTAVFMVVTTGSYRDALKPQVLITAVVTVVVLVVLMTAQLNSSFTIGGFEITSLNWVNAVVGATTATILVGLIIERFTIRPLIGQPIFAAVMVTLALAEVLSGLTTLIWGTQPKSLVVFGTPNAFTGAYVRIQEKIVIPTTGLLGEDLLIDQPRLYAFLIAMLAFIGFFLFFRYTNIGLAMRATSENQQLAESVGLRVRVILAVTWAVASVLAGIAGIMQAGSNANSTLDTNLQYVALRAFPAVLLGGLESVGGALIGGLVLGLTESWAQLLFNTDVATNLAPYLVLMAVLVIRPEGFFGEKRIDRI